jgi:RNA recognition motif-containing protein
MQGHPSCANSRPASTSLQKNSSISSASSAQCGTSSFFYALAHIALHSRFIVLTCPSQIRQGIANNTKGTAFVVYEDVMDAKSACDKLNGFNFQNRYLVGTRFVPSFWRIVY